MMSIVLFGWPVMINLDGLDQVEIVFLYLMQIGKICPREIFDL